METRELRYFIAVAEELHFGRAAERLHMAQPPLSRAIQQLEARLAVALFERAGRRVTLSRAGEVLLTEGRAALAAMDGAERRTQRAAASPLHIVLAAKAGAGSELLTALLENHRAASGQVVVDVQLVGIGEPERMMRDGRADVALLHLPFDDTAGFEFVVLHTEGQVALLPASHRLAKRKRLTLADLDSLPGLPLPRWPEPDGSYLDGPGPTVRDFVQLLQLVGLGRACAVVPESAPRFRGDVAFVPLVDAESVTTVIAWPPHAGSTAVAELVRSAVQSTPGAA